MAKIVHSLVILLNFYQLLGLIEADDAAIRQQKFTNRCNTLCVKQNETVTTVNIHFHFTFERFERIYRFVTMHQVIFV